MRQWIDPGTKRERYSLWMNDGEKRGPMEEDEPDAREMLRMTWIGLPSGAPAPPRCHPAQERTLRTRAQRHLLLPTVDQNCLRKHFCSSHRPIALTTEQYFLHTVPKRCARANL